MHCIACAPILEDSAISMVGSPIQAASRAPHKHAQKGCPRVPPHVCPSNSAFPGSGTVTIVCPSSPSSVSGVWHRLLRRWQLLCDSRTPSSQVLVLQDTGQGQSNQAGLLLAPCNTMVAPPTSHTSITCTPTPSCCQMRHAQPLQGRSAVLGEHLRESFMGVRCGKGGTASNTYCVTKSGKLCMFDEKRSLDQFIELKVCRAMLCCCDGVVL